MSCIIMQMNWPSGRQDKREKGGKANSGRVPQKQEENFAKMRTITKSVHTHNTHTGRGIHKVIVRQFGEYIQR